MKDNDILGYFWLFMSLQTLILAFNMGYNFMGMGACVISVLLYFIGVWKLVIKKEEIIFDRSKPNTS